MADEIKLIFNSLNELVKLKLLAKYSDKYNKLLTNLCDLVLIKLRIMNDDKLKLIELNCQSLKASIEFCSQPNSTLLEDEIIIGSKSMMKQFLSRIHEHLEYFEIEPESLDDYTDIRLREIVHLNCQTLFYIFNNNDLESDVQFYNRLIKQLCLILYEILVPRAKHKFKLVYDTLQQFNSRCLKYLLEEKLEIIQKYKTKEYETTVVTELNELHQLLLQEVDCYLSAL